MPSLRDSFKYLRILAAALVTVGVMHIGDIPNRVLGSDLVQVGALGCPNIRCASPTSSFCHHWGNFGCCQSGGGCEDYWCPITVEPCS